MPGTCLSGEHRHQPQPLSTASSVRKISGWPEPNGQLNEDNLKYRMEVQYADVNLGSVLYAQRRFPRPRRNITGSENDRGVCYSRPEQPRFPKSERGPRRALAWLADAQQAEGKLDGNSGPQA